MLRLTIFGKTPLNWFLLNNWRLWNRLPQTAIHRGPIRAYGNFLHSLVRLQTVRGQLPHTFFLRNRAALELVRRIIMKRQPDEALRVAVLGCSAGAEAYSIAWRVRSARPDLRLILQGMDISEQAIEVARGGVYSPAVSQITGTDIVDGMTEAEIEELFDKKADVFAVKHWIRQGIEWQVGDARQPELRTSGYRSSE